MLFSPSLHAYVRLSRAEEVEADDAIRGSAGAEAEMADAYQDMGKLKTARIQKAIDPTIQACIPQTRRVCSIHGSASNLWCVAALLGCAHGVWGVERQ